MHFILGATVAEAINWLDVQGVFVALDNFENLDEKQISSVLMNFRDTLFDIPNVWWVIIGQPGLASLVQVLDPRVAERMTGSLELDSISADELHQAIDMRVQRFHSAPGAKAPLPQEIHDFLYRSSLGEIRFVFKYASMVCLQFVSKLRLEIVDITESRVSPALIAETIGRHLVNSQVPKDTAMDLLRDMVKQQIEGIGLRPKDREVLAMIGKNGSATQSDYRNYKVNSGQDFSSNYLAKFYKQHLLAKKQEGRRVHYSLSGIAAIASQFNLLRA